MKNNFLNEPNNPVDQQDSNNDLEMPKGDLSTDSSDTLPNQDLANDLNTTPNIATEQPLGDEQPVELAQANPLVQNDALETQKTQIQQAETPQTPDATQSLSTTDNNIDVEKELIKAFKPKTLEEETKIYLNSQKVLEKYLPLLGDRSERLKAKIQELVPQKYKEIDWDGDEPWVNHPNAILKEFDTQEKRVKFIARTLMQSFISQLRVKKLKKEGKYVPISRYITSDVLAPMKRYFDTGIEDEDKFIEEIERRALNRVDRGGIWWDVGHTRRRAVDGNGWIDLTQFKTRDERLRFYVKDYVDRIVHFYEQEEKKSPEEFRKNVMLGFNQKDLDPKRQKLPSGWTESPRQRFSRMFVANSRFIRYLTDLSKLKTSDGRPLSELSEEERTKEIERIAEAKTNQDIRRYDTHLRGQYLDAILGQGSPEIDKEGRIAGTHQTIKNLMEFWDHTNGAPLTQRMYVGGLSRYEDKLATVRKWYPDARPYGDENFIYIDPETRFVTTFNPVGLDWGDIAEYGKSLFQGFFATSLGIAGLKAGPYGLYIGAGFGNAIGGSAWDAVLKIMGTVEDNRSVMERFGDTAFDVGVGAAGQRVGEIFDVGVTKVSHKIKNLITGNVENASKLVKKFEKFKIQPNLALVSDRRVFKTAQNYLQDAPIFSGKMVKNLENILESTKKAADNLLAKIPSKNRKYINEQRDDNLGAFIKEESEAATARAKDKNQEAFDKALDGISDKFVDDKDLNNTKALRQSFINESEGGANILKEQLKEPIKILDNALADAEPVLKMDKNQLASVYDKDIDTSSLNFLVKLRETIQKEIDELPDILKKEQKKELQSIESILDSSKFKHLVQISDNLGKILPKAESNRVRNALLSDIREQAIKIDPKLNDAFKTESNLTIGAFKKGKFLAAKKVDFAKIQGDLSEGQYKQIIGAFDEDITVSIGRIDVSKADLLKEANAQYKAFKEVTAKTFQEITDKGHKLEQIWGDVARYARHNVHALKVLKQNFTQGAWDDIVGNILYRLGKASPGAQDAKGEVFDISTFLARWNGASGGVSPQAKDVLFNNSRYGTLRKDLDELAEIMHPLKEIKLDHKITRSAIAVTSLSAINGMINQSFATGGKTFLAISGANFVGARIMTTPWLIKWLTTVPEANKGITSHINKLFVYATSNNFMDRLIATTILEGFSDIEEQKDDNNQPNN